MRAAWMGVIVAIVTAACGDGTAPNNNNNNNNNNNTGGTNTCTSTSASVTVSDNVFSPQCTTVAAGTTVTWTWAANAALHNVTFTSGSSSGNQDSGTFQRAFPNTGTFPYSCTLHPGMNGEVRVQ